MNRIRELRRSLLLPGLLFVATLASFWPVLRNDFIKFDDGFYVVHNPHMAGGLTLENIRWAFSTGYQGNWHPLTWLSHMMDVQVFGFRPGWHHMVSLLFHAGNAVLLMLLLNRMTGTPWRSFFVAAFFALHPLHVESVAWAAERKDVLSTFFFLLALFTYVAYVRSLSGIQPPTPAISRPRLRPQSAYALALALFALALMSKPMVVTTPFVMLLLDYWPLRRFERGTEPVDSRLTTGSREAFALKALVKEKLPFFALAAISCFVTYLVQQSHRAMYLDLPASRRIANALASYWHYLGHTIWPAHLAIFYPLIPAEVSAAHQHSTWPILLAGLALVAVSGFALAGRRRAPWFTTGWFWYVGTLLPAVGIIQVGGQAMADRYTYIPLIGIFIALVWGTTELSQNTSIRSRVVGATGALVLTACAGLTYRQATYWRSDLSVFEHALGVTSDNALAHYHVGIALRDQGHAADAMRQFRAAIEADATFAAAYLEVGALLESEGKEEEAFALYDAAVKATPWAEQIHNHMAARLWAAGKQESALTHYANALHCDPDFADAHFNLGLALASRGQFADAAVHLRAVCRLRPQDTEALGCLAEALAKEGRLNQAVDCYRDLARLAPTNAAAHQNLGLLLIEKGDLNAAMKEFRQAVGLKPDWPDALNALAWVLATHPRAEIRNGLEAVQLAERACQLSEGKQARFWSTLDVAYAETGRFAEAIAAASKAENLAEAAGQTNASHAAQLRIQSYRQQKPYRP